MQKFTFGNASKYYTKDTYNVMMVSFDGEGRTVDADIETVIPVYGVVEDFELSVDKTGNVKVYVWETSTCTPLLGDIFDVSVWF